MSENKLKYSSPGTCFEEALPLGNGSLGAMVYGDTNTEKISLNHDTLWTGKPRRLTRPNAFEAYVKAKELAMAGKFSAASDILAEDFSGIYGDAYLPLGNLYIKRISASVPSEYHRELDMATGTATVHYIEDGINFVREYFVTHPDNCLVVRITSDSPCSYEISTDSQLKSTIETRDGILILKGECPTVLAPYYSYYKPETEYDGDGIRFNAITRVVSDGKVTAQNNSLTVDNTTVLVLVLCADTSFIDFETLPTRDCFTPCLEHVEAVSLKSYQELHAAHVSDFSSYYNRVVLDLGFDESEKMTDERLRIEDKSSDLGLVELMFNFGRYLAISSSRAGTQATNLQGIWNEQLRPAWLSNYTININTEMNYWPILMCNLAELNEPLVEFIRKISITGADVSRNFYHADGYCCHSSSDLWGYATMSGENQKNGICYAYWNLSAAWLCRHLWEQYEYTLDLDFLKHTAYPLMVGAAKFLLSLLIEDGDSYILCPSTSPENTYEYNGEAMGLAKYTTMSQAIIADLFGNICRAAYILGIQDEFTAKIQEKLPKLNRYAVGSEGQLLEYDSDYPEVDVNHRHVSHLYGLYPGESITTESTPELAEACRISLERRGDYSTGWAMSWRVNLWAKLKDGDRALKLIKNQLHFVEGSKGKISYGGDGGTYANLFDAHPPFQIDGNFGVCAGVAQMLLQCEDGKLRILPALPSSFINGSVSGLKAKGDITVDITWYGGQFNSCTLCSPVAQTVFVTTPDGQHEVLLAPNQKTTLCRKQFVPMA